MYPIIGRNYYPNATLRKMPRGWHLAESRKKDPWRWNRMGDVALIGVCGFIWLLIIVQVVK